MASSHWSARKRYFPLTSIDSVVKLFEYELEPENTPNLSLLSLVVGFVENSLTSSKNTRNGNVSNQTQTASHRSNKHTAAVRDENHDASYYGLLKENQNRNNNNSSSTNGSSLLFDYRSNGDNCGEYELPPLHWNTVDAFYRKFKSQIKGSVDLSRYPKKTTRELIKRVSDVIWSNLTRSYYKDKAHLQTLYSYLTGNKLDCFGVAYAVVAACQILGLDDVRLTLSEDHCWVVFGDEGCEETCEVTWHGKGLEDKRGQTVSTSNCWLYLNGYPVVCSYQMTVAALVSAINPSISATTESEQLATLQQKLLWLLYDRGHLKLYPMAVGTLGDLEEMNPTPGVRRFAVELFNEAILIAKTHYNNHHVYPYTYLAGYLFRNGRYKEALKTWAEAATVIRNYNYTRDDEEIYKEFLEIANELIPHVVKVVSAGGCEPSRMSNVPLLQDPECFSALLTFYDGLCGWEEESSTPVLHIGWAKPFVATISKFTAFTRSKVKIKITENPENKDGDKVGETKIKSEKLQKKDTDTLTGNVNGKSPPPPLKTPEEILKSIQDEIDRNAAISDSTDANEGDNGDSYSKIAELAAACGEKILNPDYLLGNSTTATLEPNQTTTATPITTSNLDQISDSLLIHPKSETTTNRTPEEELVHSEEESNEGDDDLTKSIVTLVSQKMTGLKDLLLAEKLNTSAMQLQLTAQSQVHLTKRPRIGSFGTHNPQPELDFVATTTTLSGSVVTCGQRTSKRIRRE